MRFSIVSLLLLILGGSLTSCTCCLHFNHWYNAEKSFDIAQKSRIARADSLPVDSVWTVPEESKELRRTIEKGSRILELWPEEEEYKPKVLFLIGESYFFMGDWKPAIKKYDEYEKYFSDLDAMPTAEYHRAYALARLAQYASARFALNSIVKNKKHRHYLEALALLANIESSQDYPEEAIAALKQLLAESSASPLVRAQAHFQLGKLLFQAKRFDESRIHLKDSTINLLPIFRQYDATLTAGEALAELDSVPQAAKEMFEIIKNPKFSQWEYQTRLKTAPLLFQVKRHEDGRDMLKEVTVIEKQDSLRTQAWLLLGEHSESAYLKYEQALSEYDSCISVLPGKKWARIAQLKRSELLRFLELRKRRAKPDAPDRDRDTFQMAELFVFRLDQTDSALVLLDQIVDDTSARQSIRMRASYARAFITDEYKKDSIKAKKFYEYVLEKYPRSEFARQSQKNLGLPITVITLEEEAKEKFLEIEKEYTAIEETLTPEIDYADSLLAPSMQKLEALYQEYKTTRTGVQAYFILAYLHESVLGNPENAKPIYEVLRAHHGETPYGQKAAEKLAGKLTINQNVIDNKKNTLKVLQEAVDFDRNKKPVQKSNTKSSIKEDENTKDQLLWDYQDIYTK